MVVAEAGCAEAVASCVVPGVGLAVFSDAGVTAVICGRGLYSTLVHPASVSAMPIVDDRNSADFRRKLPEIFILPPLTTLPFVSPDSSETGSPCGAIINLS